MRRLTTQDSWRSIVSRSISQRIKRESDDSNVSDLRERERLNVFVKLYLFISPSAEGIALGKFALRCLNADLAKPNQERQREMRG